jgi:hypothetical protein
VDERVAHEAAYMLKERPPHGCQQGVLRKHISNMQDQASHCSTSRSIWPRRSTCVEAGQRGRLSSEPKGTWREMELPPHMKQECKQVAEDKLKGVLFSISIQPSRMECKLRLSRQQRTKSYIEQGGRGAADSF